MKSSSIAIIVLGGGLIKGPDERWHTTRFEKGTKESGGRLRVEAVFHLAKNEYPNAVVVVSGGWGRKREGVEDAPKLCDVIKSELIELGLSEDRIIEEANSNTTYEQIAELKKLAMKRGFNKLILMTNDYHLERMKAFLEYIPEFRKLPGSYRIKLESAEQVLLRYDPGTWKNVIEEAYSSPELKDRIEKEKNGVEDVKAGGYKF